jgi:class 3 adenylate cyclase/tetratricopeptide (TPR) repeat protein
MRCPECGQENPAGFKFCGNCGTTLVEAGETREVRKVVTVVFCDLTGSTALGEATDPEALRATMRSYYDTMRGILERHGGTVEKFIGDAVMAVFGVPIAHEDDALRAVRAAWEMRAAVPELGLRARIGVNTGEVVTGEGDTLVTGDAVNVAARLEQAAEPGEVLIGSETRRLVRDAVETSAIDVPAKGKSEPVRAFRLLEVDPDAAAIARRFDTPLIGRKPELAQLRQAFDRAVSERRCHLFTLLGPAGVGKSRLVEELLDSLDATVLEGRCLDYGEGITYWPVVSVLKQLGPRANEALRRVVEGGTLPNEVPWAVRTVLEEVAGERPLVVVFDDIQWGEPTFLDLVDHVADLSRGAPILLLCIARPEFLDQRPGWGGGKLNATTILLEPLAPAECSELIAVHGGVDDDVAERILTAAEGNPLFVEEMVALVQEDGDVRVPGTVQALLQARIDQLARDERAVIERGAVEGQVFHRGAVAELARPTEVDPQLTGLVRKELIHPTPPTLTGEQAFRFRHLLIRDAAYEALPKQTRAELHERFAGWLSTHGELIELDEVVGYHLEQAHRYHEELARPRPELAESAGQRLAAAGVRAAERNDLSGALKLLARAIALLPQGTPEWEAAFLNRLVILNATDGPEADAAVEELERSTDPRLRMHARVARLREDIASSTDLDVAAVSRGVDEARMFFANLGDDRGLAAAAELEGLLAWLRTSATETAAAMERYLVHASRAGVVQSRGPLDIIRIGPAVFGPFTPAEMREQVAHFPPDAHQRIVIEGMIAEREGRYDDSLAHTATLYRQMTEMGLSAMKSAPMNARAHTLREMGKLEESAAAYEEVVAYHRSLNQISYLSTTLIDYAETRYRLGDLAEAERLAIEGEELGSSEDLINFSRGRSVRALVAADRGDDSTALELAESAYDYAFRTDFPTEHGGAHEALAHVHRRAGRADESRREYEKALAVWERYGFTARAARARELLVEL